MSAFPDYTTPADSTFRTGYVALLGEPNVGKSTLLNALLDFKVSIVSTKPQTTRDRVAGIYNDPFCQIIFLDTPGVMNPKDHFNEILRDNALGALEDADVVYHMVDAARPRPLPERVAQALAHSSATLFLVANKADKLAGYDGGLSVEVWRKQGGIMQVEERYGGRVFCISAAFRVGLGALLAATREALPSGPALFDQDQITDRDMRYLAAEIVREKVLVHTEQEIPYAVAVQTESFIEREDSKHFVRVLIFVEHESQKGIVIGEGGSRLRIIGAEARREIEEMVDHAVFLELWVRVRKNWRKKEKDLRDFGYQQGSKGKKKR